MKKVIDLKKTINFVNKIYEDLSNIKIIQDELEELLSTIDKINLEYNRGKISKEIFDRDEKKFKKESVKIIKTVNELLSSDLNCLSLIESELTPRKITKNVSKVNNETQTTPQIEENVNNVDNYGNQQN